MISLTRPGRPLVLATAALLSAHTASAQINLTPIGSYGSGIWDDSGAEIPTYDAASQRLFVTNFRDTHCLNHARRRPAFRITIQLDPRPLILRRSHHRD